MSPDRCHDRSGATLAWAGATVIAVIVAGRSPAQPQGDVREDHHPDQAVEDLQEQ
jgi:hypothetical protein